MRVGVWLFVLAGVLAGQNVDYVKQIQRGPSVDPRFYDWTILAAKVAGSLAVAGDNTVTVRCPVGVSSTRYRAPLVVTGAANNGSGLIRLTIGGGHTLNTPYVVRVANVGGVPAASGTWSISVVSATQIDLVGSVWGGTYTSGGTVTSLIQPLYISGGVGAAEAVWVHGGTCENGVGTGTLQFKTANAHTGAWTLRSASTGLLEAMYSLPLTSPTLGGNGGTVACMSGLFLYAPVVIPADRAVRLLGTGQWQGCRITKRYTNGDMLFQGINNSDSNLTIQNIFFNGDNGAAPATGYAIHLDTASKAFIQDVWVDSGWGGLWLAGVRYVNVDSFHYLQPAYYPYKVEAGIKITKSSLQNVSNVFISNSSCETQWEDPDREKIRMTAGMLVTASDGVQVINGGFNGQYGIYVDGSASNTGLFNLYFENLIIDKVSRGAVVFTGNTVSPWYYTNFRIANSHLNCNALFFGLSVTPAAALTGGVPATVTFVPGPNNGMPHGVTVGSYMRITDGGSSETVQVTSQSGAQGEVLGFTPANSHSSGAWTANIATECLPVSIGGTADMVQIIGSNMASATEAAIRVGGGNNSYGVPKQNILIEKNNITGNNQLGAPSGGIELLEDATGVIVTGNAVSNGGVPGGMTKFGVRILDSVSDAIVAHNSLIDVETQAISIGSTFGTNTLIQDNVGDDVGVSGTPIASGSTITLPALPRNRFYTISGTTTVQTIAAASTSLYPGYTVYFRFTDASPGGFNAAGNVYRALTVTQNQQVRCVYDGVKFACQ